MSFDDWLSRLCQEGKLIVEPDWHDEHLAHYGTPRHSGRYPWGSGKKPQRSKAFIERVSELRKQGLTDAEIAAGFNMGVRDLRNRMAISKEVYKQANIARAERLKERGLSNVAIGRELGVDEHTVRTWLSDSYRRSATKYSNMTKLLERAVKEKGFIDIGEGVERYLGVSKDALEKSEQMLADAGYEIHTFQVPQASNPRQKTTFKVLCPPGTDWNEAREHAADVQLPTEYTPDKGNTVKALHRPVNISSKRVDVVFAEDGGTERDGLIELRRGVRDLDMGRSRYAQVRIGVDGTHYIKGMAVYSDDLPDGVDVRVHSNKSKTKGKLGALKEQDLANPDNPFAASIDRQNDWTDSKGVEHQGALNIVREEGQWGTWRKSLASQMLSKQPIELAKQQLGLAVKEKEDMLDEIQRITNPVVKRQMLLDFADQCDSDSTDLRGAALPRQASHVILPDPTLKENHIYAPNYKDGEEVVLIRYPHTGTFEIPRLIVDKKHAESRKMISGDDTKTGLDAVAIHPKVASQLSGADFDGDTVLVIPTKGHKIATRDPFKELQEFDPKRYKVPWDDKKYEKPDDDPDYVAKKITKKQGGKLMGEITNLITDMSFQNPTDDEIIRAVRHSMVAIDASKHVLDWQQSFVDNDIQGLKEKYQRRADGHVGGAGTLLSRASADQRVPERSRYTIDPDTGEAKWIESKRTYYDKKTGKYKEAEEVISRMSSVKDARELLSGTGNPMEIAYADHANALKGLANKARKASLSVPSFQYSRTAAETYSKEVESLLDKLDKSFKNAPIERKAQAIAKVQIDQACEDNPYLRTSDGADDMKKLRGMAIRNARATTGARRYDFQITDKEWEAIQAGAVSKTKLEQILLKADSDRVKELAMPRQTTELSSARISRIQAMFAAGHSQTDIADALGLSPSTVLKYVS